MLSAMITPTALDPWAEVTTVMATFDAVALPGRGRVRSWLVPTAHAGSLVVTASMSGWARIDGGPQCHAATALAALVERLTEQELLRRLEVGEA